MMRALAVQLDDGIATALEKLAGDRGCAPADIAANALRRIVEQEQLRQFMQDPCNEQLIRELDEENVALAEEGMAEYAEMLRKADLRFCPPGSQAR